MCTVEIVCLTSEKLELRVTHTPFAQCWQGEFSLFFFSSIPSLPPRQSWLPALPSTDLSFLVSGQQWLKALPLSVLNCSSGLNERN